MKTQKEIDDLISVIQCMHAQWYSETENPFAGAAQFLKFHSHLGALFNFAGIRETLCSKNPGELTPEQALNELKRKGKI